MSEELEKEQQNIKDALKNALKSRIDADESFKEDAKRLAKEKVREGMKSVYKQILQDRMKDAMIKAGPKDKLSVEQKAMLNEVVVELSAEYADLEMKRAFEHVYDERVDFQKEVIDSILDDSESKKILGTDEEESLEESVSAVSELLADDEEKEVKKLTPFRIAMIAYAAVWILLTIIVCCVLHNKFAKYQAGYDAAKNAIDPYAIALSELYRFDNDHFLESAGEEWVTVNKYEAADAVTNYINETLSGKTLSCSENEASTERHPSYDVYADSILVGQLTLKHRPEADSYGFHDYEFDSLQICLSQPETDVYTIKTYDGDTVLVNGQILSEDDITVFVSDAEELGSYMAMEASDKSGVTITEKTYVLTDFINEPEVTLEKYDESFSVSDNSLRVEVVAVGDEDTNDSSYYFNTCLYFDSQLDYDLNDRLYNGFVNASEAFIYNMNRYGSFYEISKYLEYGGAAYNAINSAQSGLSWAGRPDEFEIKSTELLNIVKFDDTTLVVTTHHNIHRLYRGETYEEEMTVEWLYCKNGNAWLIRNFSYL